MSVSASWYLQPVCALSLCDSVDEAEVASAIDAGLSPPACFILLSIFDFMILFPAFHRRERAMTRRSLSTHAPTATAYRMSVSHSPTKGTSVALPSRFATVTARFELKVLQQRVVKFLCACHLTSACFVSVSRPVPPSVTQSLCLRGTAFQSASSCGRVCGPSLPEPPPARPARP